VVNPKGFSMIASTAARWYGAIAYAAPVTYTTGTRGLIDFTVRATSQPVRPGIAKSVKDDVRRILPEAREARAAALGFLHGMSGLPQQKGERRAHVRIIVNEQHAPRQTGVGHGLHLLDKATPAARVGGAKDHPA
jgi:hypothetical protein